VYSRPSYITLQEESKRRGILCSIFDSMKEPWRTRTLDVCTRATEYSRTFLRICKKIL